MLSKITVKAYTLQHSSNFHVPRVGHLISTSWFRIACIKDWKSIGEPCVNIFSPFASMYSKIVHFSWIITRRRDGEDELMAYRKCWVSIWCSKLGLAVCGRKQISHNSISCIHWKPWDIWCFRRDISLSCNLPLTSDFRRIGRTLLKHCWKRWDYKHFTFSQCFFFIIWKTKTWAPPGWLSGERVGFMIWWLCDPRLRRLFLPAYFRLSRSMWE